jgi:hypothetical protein
MSTLPSGLPDSIASDEELARFLTQSSQFNSVMVKPAVFLPSPKSQETSVSRHGREPASRLWEIGLAAAGDRPLYGAAIFTVAMMPATLLALPDEPPLRHAVIRGWPWLEHDPDLQKAQQKELAVRLASAAGPPFLRGT